MVNAQLEHLDGLAKLATLRPGEPLTGEIRTRLTSWAALIGRQPAVSRQILRKLLIGRLTLTPRITAESRWYEFTGRASYNALLAGVVNLVPPGRNLRG